MFLCGQMFSTHLGKYLGTLLLGFVTDYFSLVRYRQTAFQSGCTFPPAMNETFCCFIFLTSSGGVSAMEFGLPDRCILVPHCYFNLQFPNDI